MKKPSKRAGAIEGVSLVFARERPVPPRLPFFLTYVGSSVEEIADVGVFQQGTRAEVSRAVALRYRGQAGWLVEDRPKSRFDDDHDVDE